MVAIPLSDSAKEAQLIAASNDLGNGSAQAASWEYGDDAAFTNVLLVFNLDNTPYVTTGITGGSTTLTGQPVAGTGLITGTATHARAKDRTGAVIWEPLVLPSSVAITASQQYTLESTLTQL